MTKGLVAVLIPPSLDPKQALRLRRFALGAGVYAITAALVVVAWSFGVLPARAALQVLAIYLAINVALYAAIRSGFNLRFADPSLTRFQILAAITQVMFIVYHMDDGREIALSGCFIVFLFGIFRLGARDFATIVLYTLASYAVVLVLLTQWRPHAIPSLELAWMSWLMLAGFLPCFAVVGAQIIRLRRRLLESEAGFRGLTEMSSDLYWETDAEHRLSKRSSPHARHGGAQLFRQAVAIGQRRWDVASVTPDAAGWEAHRRALDAHEPFRGFEFSRRMADGNERHVSISGDPMFDAKGAFQGYRGVGSDVSARKRAEQALRESAQELQLFADNSPAMTVSWDAELRYRFASKAFTDFYGITLDEIRGKHVREFLGEDVYREVEVHLRRALLGQAVTYRRAHAARSGQTRSLEVRIIPHVGEQGRFLGCFGLITDITEQTLARERVERLAHHDSLTGLPNRLHFDDRLGQAVALARRESRGFALLYLDLDRFKPVNDTLGHAAGDAILQAVALRIGAQVRASDTVARVGGDEFTVILPGIIRREAAQAVARKIADALAQPFELEGRAVALDIGVSIGVALYPADGEDAPALVKAADAAMYAAKPARGPHLDRAA